MSLIVSFPFWSHLICNFLTFYLSFSPDDADEDIPQLVDLVPYSVHVSGDGEVNAEVSTDETSAEEPQCSVPELVAPVTHGVPECMLYLS